MKPNMIQPEPPKKLPDNLSKDRISIQTKDKVEAAKSFIESSSHFFIPLCLPFF